MQNNGIRLPAFKLLCMLLTFTFLLACSETGTQTQPGKKLPQAGMHVYKDPLTGKFIPRPPISDQSARQVQPPPLPPVHDPENNAQPTSREMQEYESPAVGGGILLDLPVPYSDSKE